MAKLPNKDCAKAFSQAVLELLFPTELVGDHVGSFQFGPPIRNRLSWVPVAQPGAHPRLCRKSLLEGYTIHNLTLVDAMCVLR